MVYRKMAQSSHANTLAPPRTKDSIAALPDLASPMTATVLFKNDLAIINFYLSFSVERPISAKTTAIIQNRITTVGSAQPFFSK